MQATCTILQWLQWQPQCHVSVWNAMEALIQDVLDLPVSSTTSVIGVHRPIWQTRSIRPSFAHTSKNNTVAHLVRIREHHMELIETLNEY